jgi:hypothetical protein
MDDFLEDVNEASVKGRQMEIEALENLKEWVEDLKVETEEDETEEVEDLKEKNILITMDTEEYS